MLKPYINLPLIYMVFISLSPSLYALSKYILINKGGWTIELIAANELAYGLTYSFLFLCFINFTKGARFDFMMLIGSISWALFIAFCFFMLFVRQIPFNLMFVIRFVQLFLGHVSGDFLLATMVGKVAKRLPDGFESTGITVVISLANMSGIWASALDSWEIKRYGCTKGYYNRMQTPLLINFGYSIFLVLLAPLFLRWRK